MPTAEPAVRAASRGDIPAIVEVSLSSVTDEEEIGFGSPRSQSPFADVGRLSAAWEDPNRVMGSEVVVADVGGRVVGVVTLEDRGESLELVNIDVTPEWKGKGIGRRLVRFVEERARREGKRAVTLGTSRNAAGVPWKSLPWWQHLGYRITHEEENAWTRAIGPGVREIRMRKDLAPMQDVALRTVEAADLPIFFEHQRDPEANRMAAFTPVHPEDRTAFEERWNRLLRDASVTMRTITLQGTVVGSVGSYADPDLGRREVTFWIGRERWGQGIATRALIAFLEFETTRPLYARAAADNAASIRVLEKSGFTVCGRARGFANGRGQEIEEVVMILTTARGPASSTVPVARTANP